MATDTTKLELLITAQADQFKREMAGVQSQLDGLKKKQKETSEGFADGFKQALPTMSALAAGLAAAAVAADTFKNAFAMEDTLADFSALTGITGDALADIGNKATELSNKFGTSALQNVDAFKGVLSRLGPDIAKDSAALQSMGDSINTLAIASGLDATSSMDALTTAMLQFGVSLDDPAAAAKTMAEMMNTMAAGAQQGAAEIPQIAEALKQVGVTASGLNVSFNETNAAIQVLAAGGKTGSEAGIALRNMLTALVQASGPGEEALAKLGLSTKSLGKMLTEQGLSSALSVFNEKLSQYGGAADQAALKAVIFGKENLAAAGVLLKGSEDISDLNVKITGTNTAYEQAAVKSKTFSAQIAILGANVQNKLTAAFSALTPILTFAVQAISGLMKYAIEFAPVIMSLTAVYAAYTIATKASAIADLAKAAATKIAESSMVSFGKAMLANPMMLAVTGAAIAVGALITVTNKLNDARMNTAQAQAEETKQQLEQNNRDIEAAKAKKSHLENTQKLFDAYEKLGANQSRTKEQSAQYQEVQDKIHKLYPGLIKSGGDYAENLIRIKEASRATQTDLAGLADQMNKLDARQKQITRQAMADKYSIAAEDLAKVIKDDIGNLATDITGQSGREAKKMAGTALGWVSSAKTIDEVNNGLGESLKFVDKAFAKSSASVRGKMKELVTQAAEARRAIVAAMGGPVKETPKAAPNAPVVDEPKKKKEKEVDLVKEYIEEQKLLVAVGKQSYEQTLTNLQMKLAAQGDANKKEMEQKLDLINALRGVEKDYLEKSATDEKIARRNSQTEFATNAIAAYRDVYGGFNDILGQNSKNIVDVTNKTKEATDAQRLLAETVMAVGDAMVGLATGKKDAAKEGLKAVLLLGLQYAEKKLILGQAASVIDAIINPIGMIKNIPLLVAAELAIQGARAAINSWAVGTTSVPYDQIAQVHRGEMIIPRTFSEGIRRGEVALSGGGAFGASAKAKRERSQRFDVSSTLMMSSFESGSRYSAQKRGARAY